MITPVLKCPGLNKLSNITGPLRACRKLKRAISMAWGHGGVVGGGARPGTGEKRGRH